MFKSKSNTPVFIFIQTVFSFESRRNITFNFINENNEHYILEDNKKKLNDFEAEIRSNMSRFH